jgi:cytochrome c oxidase subunit IV
VAEHIASRKMYVLIFTLLILLTALTTAAAFVDLGPFNTVVALVIAMVKATLVALFFMHLKWSSHLSRLAAIAALFWLAILIALSLSDYLTRNSPPPPTGWQAPSMILPRL